MKKLLILPILLLAFTACTNPFEKEERSGLMIDPIPNCEEEGSIVDIYTEKYSSFPMGIIETRTIYEFDTGYKEVIPGKYLTDNMDPAYYGWKDMNIGDKLKYTVSCPEQKLYQDNQQEIFLQCLEKAEKVK